jgi:urea transport system substrate-binding protein
MMKRRGFLKSAVALGAVLATVGLPQYAFAEGETIKVGVLHSLSGTMAISETTLKDVMLMLIRHRIGHCLLKKRAA